MVILKKKSMNVYIGHVNYYSVYRRKRSNATRALLAFVVVFLSIVTGFIDVEEVLANPLGFLNTIYESLIRPLASDVLNTFGLNVFALFIALIVLVSVYQKNKNS